MRLYHGPARFELIIKDYQGEDVSLGSDQPIQQFFADCDAVLLCLDPAAAADPAELRRRQQEVEGLLEGYIDRSDDGSVGRPVALLAHQVRPGLGRLPTPSRGAADVVAGDLVSTWSSGCLSERYGMTRHALAAHAPEGGVFAVSSFGTGAIGNRPPAELHPLGLEGPLGWVAQQLEAGDRADMELLWKLAPGDVPRLKRCLAAYEKRYPRSNRSFEFLDRLKKLEQKRGWRRLARVTAAAIAGLGDPGRLGLAGLRARASL